MANLFGYKRSGNPEAVFSNEDSLLTFGSLNAAATGYLVQNWSASYQQQVQEVFELGSNALYWSRGRPQGAAGLGRVVGLKGPSKAGVTIPAEAYDACNGGASMSITASGAASCGKNTAHESVTLSLTGVLVVSQGYDANVQDTMLKENIQLRFAGMGIE